MLQKTQGTTLHKTNESQTPQKVNQDDHAFPMLGAEQFQMPPHFRFMWAAR